MLFEAACFDGTNIRLSGKKLGLRTDAAAKFEKGLDPNNAMAIISNINNIVDRADAVRRKTALHPHRGWGNLDIFQASRCEF